MCISKYLNDLIIDKKNEFSLFKKVLSDSNAVKSSNFETFIEKKIQGNLEIKENREIHIGKVEKE